MASNGVAGQSGAMGIGLSRWAFGFGVIFVAVSGCAEIDSDELIEDETAEAIAPITYNVASLVTPRHYATATVLSNGKVLVAGGLNAPTPHATAEVYDPATDQWTATPPMTGNPAYRERHTATLLASGKVFVVGGRNATTGNDTTTFYDPDTNAWSPGPGMSHPRYEHSATMLLDGRLLVVGGTTGTSTHNSVRIYNSVANTWANGPSMSFARRRHTATLLDDGRVLVVGGSSDGTYLGVLGSTEIYNPTTATWTPGLPLKTARFLHTATKLSNGCVLIVGGIDASENVPAAERYCFGNPDTIIALSGNAAKRVQHTAVTLPDGRVLVAGGRDVNGNALKSADIFNPATNSWQTTDILQVARSRHMAVNLVGDRVLFIGGTGAAHTTIANVELSRLSVNGNLGSVLPTSISANTCFGIDDFAPPPACASSHNEDRGYLWQAPFAGHYRFTTVDPAFTLDTALYLLDPRTDILLPAVNGQPACNDNTLGVLQSTVDANLASGQRVLAVVDGYGDRCGAFKLSVSALCQVGLSCTTGQPGVCSAGTTQCNQNSTQACFRTTSPTTEVCDDQLDNDCDGSVDEGCSVSLMCLSGPYEGQPCFSASNCKGHPCVADPT